MTIELVVHVWCPPGWDGYAEMMLWQYSYLVESQVPVTYTVCYSSEDPATSRYIKSIRLATPIPNVRFNPIEVEPGRLFRRAILRGERAAETTADVIWFTDVDYLFTGECLSDVARQVGPESSLYYPETVQICKDHATGDSLLETSRTTGELSLDPQYYTSMTQRKAIGGVQIIGGRTANRIGYLNGTRWTKPVSSSQGFRSCRCDRKWRRSNKLTGEAIPIRGVYRLRHTRKGRDLNLAGEYVGREAW